MNKIIKSAAILLSVVGLSSTAYSQGQIYFSNGSGRQITYMDGSFAGNNTTVGLYWSANTSAPLDQLELGATTKVIAIGLFTNGGNPVTLSAPPDTMVTVEIRAWDNGAESYEAALALGTGNVGTSGRLNTMTLGGVAIPDLIIQGGLQGFNLTIVPEPSTIALGILGGLGAMVLLRRRK